jgi:hypothetical protein
MSDMINNGADAKDVDAALDAARNRVTVGIYEVKMGNDGVATPYTTPSSYAIAGAIPPNTVQVADGASDVPGGTSIEAIEGPSTKTSTRTSTRKTSRKR